LMLLKHHEALGGNHESLEADAGTSVTTGPLSGSNGGWARVTVFSRVRRAALTDPARQPTEGRRASDSSSRRPSCCDIAGRWGQVCSWACWPWQGQGEPTTPRP